MKTKLIIFSIAATALLFSCSDRNEDEVVQPANTKLELKKLKINKENSGTVNKAGDTIIPPDKLPANTNTDGNTIQPSDPDPVVDPTKPDKPW